MGDRIKMTAAESPRGEEPDRVMVDTDGEAGTPRDPSGPDVADAAKP